MKKKLRVALLFGGKSAEHEISLISARNIVAAMDKNKYDIVAIGIDKQGRWHLDEGARLLLGGEKAKVEFRDARNAAAIMPGNTATPMVRRSGAAGLAGIDVVFPILHGPFGEDGTVQGLLKLANLPFVGAGVLGSAVGMDKDVMKRLLRDAGIAIGKFMAFERADKISFAKVKRTLGMPLFVKPANLGSSVGISKVSQAQPVQRRDQRGVPLRQQNRHRRVHRRPRDRVFRARQRPSDRFTARRNRRQSRFLFLRCQVSRRARLAPGDPRQTTGEGD